MESVFVIKNASNETIVGGLAFANLIRAKRYCAKLCDNACNPNSYYVEELEIINN